MKKKGLKKEKKVLKKITRERKRIKRTKMIKNYEQVSLIPETLYGAAICKCSKLIKKTKGMYKVRNGVIKFYLK